MHEARDNNDTTIAIVFAPERKLSAQDLRRHTDEYDLFTPDDPSVETVNSLSIADLHAIASVRYPELDFSEEAYPTEIAELAINAIRSEATTPEEAALGRFTRRKLKKLSTWPLWRDGECKQLDQFVRQRLYGEPCYLPKGGILMRTHWQYHIKRDGTRRSRNCCDGSPQAVPFLHGISSTYSSCVEQPVQRLYFALMATLKGYHIYGGNVKDAYAHSLPPDHLCWPIR